MLDLACAESLDGAYVEGTMVNIIGDSHSGKTMLALSGLAATAQEERFEDYRLIYDDVEHALEMDIPRLFGKKLARRLEAPKYDSDGDPVYSDTVEDFHANVLRAIKKGKPFIYLLDSLDAISADADEEKVEKAFEARENGKDVSGSYGMAKPKKMSELLRQIVGKLKKVHGLLIIISQTRDNIDPMSFQKKSRAGGKALKFYCTHEIWLAAGKKQKKRDYIIGGNSIAKVSKNKVTGKVRECNFSIFYDIGIDDVAANVDYLIDTKVWSGGGKSKISTDVNWAPDLSKEKLIRHIEDNNLERKLAKRAYKAWLEVEESLKLERKARFE